MVKIKILHYTCLTCGSRTQVYDQEEPFKCQLCNIVICPRCSPSSSCPTCYSLLEQSEKQELENILENIGKARKGSLLIATFFCIGIPIALLSIPFFMNEEPAAIGILIAGCGMVALSGIVGIPKSMRDKKWTKIRDEAQVRIGKLVAERKVNAVADLVIRAAMKPPAMTEPKPATRQIDHKFCMTCGVTLVDSQVLDPQTNRPIRTCPQCGKNY
ncbi:MAG: hypothetical protein ACFFCS_20835 [Candidatus Hodarchaeota archaeon]